MIRPGQYSSLTPLQQPSSSRPGYGSPQPRYYPSQPQYYPPRQAQQSPYYAYQQPPRQSKAWPFVLLGVGVLLILLVFMGMALYRVSANSHSNFNGNNSLNNWWGEIERVDHSAVFAERYNSSDTWAIYWYLCGSDLETDSGLASIDFDEVLAVHLPANVQVVVETGGARRWRNDINPNVNTRFLYDSNGLQLLEEIPQANMGSSQALQSFLEFCLDNYPADHQIVIFWNHGGGSVGGVMFDENFNYDSLSLPEIAEAFAAVSTPAIDDPPFEMIGFDACLMATVDVAEIFTGYAKWLVASQEMEPGLGWYYTGFLQALADDPGIGGATLGREICDSYYSACQNARQAGDITLSVVDLGQLEALLDAYHNVGAESLLSTCADSTFVSDFGRAARMAQSYGFNDTWDGYTNMVDMGDLINQSGRSLFPQFGAELLHALDNCVVYQVMGPYRDRASGLSCFYNYSGNVFDYKDFATLQADNPFRWYYYYELAGELNAEGTEYLQNLVYHYAPNETITPEQIESAAVDNLENWPVLVSADGIATLELGQQIASKLTGVYVYLAYFDANSGIEVYLGRDNNIYADWDNGVFRDNFTGRWGSIDGRLVFMELIDEAVDYQLYSVPVRIDGEEYTLLVSYDVASEEYEILGARHGIIHNGMSDRNLQELVPGDIVEPILYVMLDTPGAEFEQMPVGWLVVNTQTSFYEIDLGDGIFFYEFEMVDWQNNSYRSEYVVFEVHDGNVQLYTADDYAASHYKWVSTAADLKWVSAAVVSGKPRSGQAVLTTLRAAWHG